MVVPWLVLLALLNQSALEFHKVWSQKYQWNIFAINSFVVFLGKKKFKSLSLRSIAEHGIWKVYSIFSILSIKAIFLYWQNRNLLSFSCSVVSHFLTPWSAALQASLSFTISQNLLKLISIESKIPSNYLILCHPFSSCLQPFPVSGSFPKSWPILPHPLDFSIYVCVCVCVCVCVLVTQSCPTLCDFMDIVCKILLSMEFSRQEYGSGLPCLSLGDLPNSDWTQVSCIAGRFFTIWATREAVYIKTYIFFHSLRGKGRHNSSTPYFSNLLHKYIHLHNYTIILLFKRSNHNATMSFSTQSISQSEKAMAPHSSTLAWKIPWMEEPGGSWGR